MLYGAAPFAQGEFQMPENTRRSRGAQSRPADLDEQGAPEMRPVIEQDDDLGEFGRHFVTSDEPETDEPETNHANYAPPQQHSASGVAPQQLIQAPDRNETIAARTANTLDMATSEIIGRLRGLGDELAAVERMVIEDAARVKMQIHEHVELGNVALRLGDQIRAEMKELMAKRAAVLNAVVQR